MKDSHFELPRSQYMENQSQRSRRTVKPCEFSFDGGFDNCDTNEGSTAAIFSPPKKIISWEQVLQECDPSLPL